MIETRVLACHAGYRCRDAGACCTAGWPIPVEDDRARRIDGALADGTLPRVRGGAPVMLHRQDAEAGGVTLLGIHGSACAFFDTRAAHHCSIQRHLGHDALPLACRQFPRVSVIDRRGPSIALSHVCPTAAAMLTTPGRLTIVVNAPGFPGDGEYVGLDVRDGLPPALRPDMLMTWEGWWRLESRVVDRIDAAVDAAEAVAALGRIVERVRVWSPADGPLDTVIDEAFDHPSTCTHDRALPSIDEVVLSVLAAVPGGYRTAARDALSRRTSPLSAEVHRRLVAAHAFANWTAHFGEGLRTWLRSIEAVHVLATAGVAAGDVDLVLRHLVDPYALARGWGSAESSR